MRTISIRLKMPKKANPNQRRLVDFRRSPCRLAKPAEEKPLSTPMVSMMVLKGPGVISILLDFRLIRWFRNMSWVVLWIA